jgi:hypothetical protein
MHYIIDLHAITGHTGGYHLDGISWDDFTFYFDETILGEGENSVMIYDFRKFKN